MRKSTKSHLRGFSILLKNTFRVHELVARSSAWQVRAANGKAKIGGFVFRAISAIPRVRTCHTRKPSRFVHALPARPLKVHGGRDSSTCADESRAFCQPSPVGEGGSRRLTDEVLLYVYCQSKPYLAMFALKLLPKAQPPCLGDADRVCFANRSIPARFAVA